MCPLQEMTIIPVHKRLRLKLFRKEQARLSQEISCMWHREHTQKLSVQQRAERHPRVSVMSQIPHGVQNLFRLLELQQMFFGTIRVTTWILRDLKSIVYPIPGSA